MKHPALGLTPDLFERFDLEAIAEELLGLARSAGDGKAARTLLKSAELTLVVMALRAGGHLLEHSAPGPLLVVPLRGHASFTDTATDTLGPVRDRTVLLFGPGRRHAVTAEDDAAFLLVIGGRPSAD